MLHLLLIFSNLNENGSLINGVMIIELVIVYMFVVIIYQSILLLSLPLFKLVQPVHLDLEKSL